MASIPFIMLYITLGILILGIVLMALGNKLNLTHGTKLMCMRILSQALAVTAIAVLYFFQRKM
jgi:hypothetical protein